MSTGRGSLRAAIIGVVSVGLVAYGAQIPAQSAVRMAAPRAEAPGNPLTLPPLPSSDQIAPRDLPPVFERSVVSPTQTVATSTLPTFDSGEKAQGQYTFFVSENFSKPQVTWKTYSTGKPTLKSPVLIDGRSYLWKVQIPDNPNAKPPTKNVVKGPYQLTVDTTAPNYQDSDGLAGFQVALASGFGHFQLSTHQMLTAHAQIGIGLDYSPSNGGWAGVPVGWRIIQPSVSQYDQLVVTGDGTGTVNIHSRTGNWLNYQRGSNGVYQAVYGQVGQNAPTGTLGTLIQNANGTWTLTDSGSAVTVFGKAKTRGANGTQVIAYVTSVSLGGQESVDAVNDDDTGLLTELTDSVTGRTVDLVYGGGKCPQFANFVPAPVGMLCQIKFWDGSTTAIGYVSTGGAPQIGRMADYPEAGADGAQVTDIGYDKSGLLVSSIRSPLVASALGSPGARDTVGTDPDPADPRLLTTVTYDGAGRVAAVTAPAPTVGATQPKHTYSYPDGQNSTTIVSGNRSATFKYDPNSFRTLSTETNGKQFSKNVYNDNGDPIAQTDQHGGVKTSTYYPDGMLKTSTGPTLRSVDNGSPATTTEYDQTFASEGDSGDGKDLHGLDVQYWANTSWANAPDAADLGPKASAQAPLPNYLNVTWLDSPIPGAHEWSARLTGSLRLDDPQNASNPDKYTFKVNGSGPARLWIDQLECTTAAPCANIQLSGGKHAIRVDMAVNADEPGNGTVQVLMKKGTGDLGNVPMNRLSPNYNEIGTQTVQDSLSKGSSDELVTKTSYAQPEIAQATAVWNGAGLVSKTLYQRGADGTAPVDAPGSRKDNAARIVGTVMPNKNKTTRTYWGNNESASSGCANQGDANQAGMPKSWSQPDPDPQRGPKTGTTTRTWFGADGRLAASQTGAAPTACFAYDDAGRIKNTIQSGQNGKNAISYDYASNGNPLVTKTTSTTDKGTTSSLVTVDLLGESVSSTDAWGTTTQTTYDQYGQVTQEVTRTPGNTYVVTATTTYDDDGNITGQSITDSRGSTPVTASPHYDGTGWLTSATYSNGTAGAFTYDANERPAQVSWNDNDKTTKTAWQSSNIYSRAGRILTSTMSGGGKQATFDYTYDDATRLGKAHLDTTGLVPTGDASWTYQYDDNSNRTLQSVNRPGTSADQTIKYTIDPDSDQLTDVDGDPQLSGKIQYDDDGNITDLGPLDITYDIAGQAVAIHDDKQNTTITFERDALENVLSKTTKPDSGGPTVTIRYTQGGLILDTNNQPTLQQAGLVAGVMVQRVLTGTPTQTWLYPTINGSTLITTDQAGVPTSKTPNLYDPFGQALTNLGPSDPAVPDFGWNASDGIETESLTLPVLLNGARLYVPALGRFTSVDPQSGGSANNYDYANQDPINGSDATGNTAWWKQLLSIVVQVVVAAAVTIFTSGVGDPFIAGLYVAEAGAEATAEEVAAVVATTAAKQLATKVVAGAIYGAVGAAATYAATTPIMGNDWSWSDFGWATLGGAVTGAAAIGVQAAGESFAASKAVTKSVLHESIRPDIVNASVWQKQANVTKSLLKAGVVQVEVAPMYKNKSSIEFRSRRQR